MLIDLVVYMEKQLKSLFKPYHVRFKTIADFRNKSTRMKKIFDEDRLIERLKSKECSKSKNKMCGNMECKYNLLKYDFNGDVNG